MQFKISSVAVAILAATSAVALPQSTSEVKPLRARNSVNDCGSSSFENKSSGGSPKVSDCQQIAANIAGSGSWSVDLGGGVYQVVQSGSCAFSLQGHGDVGRAYIGNSDIIDLINQSITNYQWQGMVGSKGDMKCQSTGSVDVDVTWGIYHT